MQRQQQQQQQQSLEDQNLELVGQAVDETGRPVVIVKQTQKSKARGKQCLLENASKVLALGNMMKTSIGPRGADKIITEKDGNLTITNDGATVLKSIDVADETVKLFVQLSASQDKVAADSTTSTLLLACALVQQGIDLVKQDLHPTLISDSYERCALICEKLLNEIKQKVDINTELGNQIMQKLAKTTLNSKILKSDMQNAVNIAIEAAQAQNLNYLKLPSDGIAEQKIFSGLIMENAFSHPLMQKKLENKKILIASFPFEPPTPKSQFNLQIQNAEQYSELLTLRDDYFQQLRTVLAETKPDIVVSQYGFDDEANQIFCQANISAIRWVKSDQIEKLAMITKGKIVARLEEVTAEKLGYVTEAVEEVIGTENTKIVKIQNATADKNINKTIIIQASNLFLADEIERSFNDAVGIVKHLIAEPYYVYGGAATEIYLAGKINQMSLTAGDINYFGYKAFATALESLAIQLATNSGLNGVQIIQQIKQEQNNENSCKFGVDCMQVGTDDMSVQGVIETFQTVQVVRMLFKISEVIVDNE